MLEHVLVPKHELLTDEEAEELLADYDVTREQMPMIKNDDPAIKHMEERKEGDIIRITRENPNIGVSYYYRVIIEG